MANIQCLVFVLTVPFCIGITVNTKLGEITGKIQSVDVGPKKVSIATYLGIPYAEPPIGDRRFTKPVSMGKFESSFEALSYSPSCLQKSFFPYVGKTSEDCLYLNIFSPDITQNGKKFSVMIWIHGGAFLYGSGQWRTYEKLAALGQVILVTINYRLGVFGFLNTGDGAVHANNGLWDQHTAIKWVYDNIESFNGDQNSITIFGESAGSASVMYQAIYPGNIGLFKRVIAQSGSANAPWAIVNDPAMKARDFAKHVNCSTSTSSATIECLRKLTNIPKLLSKGRFSLLHEDGIDWSPSIDGVFVTQDRLDALNWPRIKTSLPHFNNLDLLMGTNGHESQLSFFFTPPKITPAIKQDVRDLVMSNLLMIYGHNITDAVMNDVMFEYSNYQNPLNNGQLIRKQFSDMLTDTCFYAPTVASLTNHVLRHNNSKTYQYQFNEIHPNRPWIPGARHADDLAYVFGSIYDEAIASNWSSTVVEKQWKLSSTIITYWTNFAKTGNPNLPEKVPVEWKEFIENKRNYLYLTSAEIKNGEHLHARRTAFWLEHFPKLLDRVKREQEESARILKEQRELDSIKKELDSIKREERNCRVTQTSGSSKTVNNSIFVTVLVVFVYVEIHYAACF